MAERNFQAVYYRAADGSEPVRQYVGGLDDRRRTVLLNQVDRLNLLTDAIPHLPFPHSSQIDGKLRELRCHVGSELYRVLYRRSERLIVVLHVFRKKTKKKFPRRRSEWPEIGGTTSRSGWTLSRVGHREQLGMTRP
jgi:phage-related protein